MPCSLSMKILPIRTEPPATVISRRHGPPQSAYGKYRACLRWEFGFTCAFCLTHEADLVEHGTEGWGLIWIEHFVPQKTDLARINDYTNCYWSCRFCNEARHDAPNVDERGRHLLDPCLTPWSEHFEMREDALLACDGDADAAYTRDTYDLDDPRKKVMRRSRAEALTEAFRTLRDGPDRLQRLVATAERSGSSTRAILLDEAQRLRELMPQALRQVERFRAVPTDRDESCRCSIPDHCSLPAFLDSQVQNCLI
jgi:hypothetical protein